MCRKTTKKWLSFCLAVAMLVSVLPLNAFSVDSSGSVTNYADFLKNLKVLEQYADEYAAQVYGKDAGELVLNFIRTGVERYQDDNWNTLAGYENTGFTNYVKAQDAENNTTAMNLKNIVIKDFKLPNGNKVDFGHMFGCMNISYVAKGSADLSGWAGDICDLLQYSVENIDAINKNTDGSIESMAAYIQKNCFGVDASGAFGWDDFWGDMDAYYLVSEYKKANGTKTFSELMEAYFTGVLNDTDRTVYFMNNRFAVADNKEAVRKAIYESYSADVGVSILESKRGLSSYSSLREACCYAVADYIYSKAQGQLVEGSISGSGPENGYYSVFSNENSILAPGVKQDINYAQTVDGKQIVYYVATVDVKRDDVEFFVNYNNNEPPVAGKNIGLQSVRDQVAALVENNKHKENFYPIVATNGAGFNITTGDPAGLVVMQGVEYSKISAPGFFAILKDDTAVIGDQAKYDELKEQGKIKEAIQAFGSVLIKDGEINVTKSANYTANRASRTAIGITADGKVVMMVLDGRQLPFSAGGSLEEIAQIMLEAGCVDAVNLDGGGSTTYMSKPAGSDEIDVVNRPSDGYERNVSTSLVVVSTAKPSTEFDSAIISADYEYITAGTSMQFSVTGVSNTGNAAAIPAGSYWRVSDESVGYIDKDTGLFTALDNGEVTVQYIFNGEVKGSKLIQVVIPDDIKFAEDRITAIYDEPKEIGVTVWYQGYPVAFTPLMDMALLFSPGFDEEGNPILESSAGVIDGMTLIATDAKGMRTVSVIAALQAGEDVIVKYATVNLYYSDETTFDFANATMGNRNFAWLREIENATTLDNQLYRVSDPDSPIVIDYTFALDMTAIDFPPQLEPMKSMLPTFNENSTAWDYLLQLAERVCTQTNVTIRAEFSKDLDVDISELNIRTEYFEATSINLDENNVLTIVCHWKNQSQPIDPATANSLCILTGIKATVKDSAAFYDNKIAITNNGTVSYDIYLAASSLYSFAQNPENQAKYGIYPYIHEEDCRSDFVTDDPNADENESTATNNDRGARFSSQYVDFADAYLISTEILNGWREEGRDYYYYVNNVPLTGTQLVPDRHDATKDRFYEFDDNGKLVSENGLNGLITLGGELYYAVLGEAQKGWQQINGNNYYFHPDTGKAVDGVVSILERIYPTADDPTTATYTYTFTNHVLTRGDLRRESDGGITGLRYRWAGNWVANGWFVVDGDTYHVDSHRPINGKTNWGCFVTVGYGHYISAYGREGAYSNDTISVLFDENGVLQENFTGAVYTGTTYGFRCFKNGVLYATPGLLQGNDGHYYYVSDAWDGTAKVGQNIAVAENKALGIAAGTYTFDQYGRLTNNLLTNVTIVNNTKAEIVTEVIGRVLTVKHTAACKVLYKNEHGKYVLADAMVNPYGTSTFASNGASEYNFAIEKGAKEIQIVLAGDLNFDGVVNEADEKLLADALNPNSNTKLSELQALVADLDGDGEITIADRAILARCKLENDHPMYKELEW